MAEVAKGNHFRIAAADDYILGAAHEGYVSSWLIQLTSDSFSGSITIKGKAHGETSTADYTAITYKDLADGQTKTAAITGSALILVDAAGLSVDIDCTSYTSGGMYVDANPLMG